ncbi:MAG: carbamate kinase, partial [Clostridiales bacterium]|nr:carbamate kinase [Clostridiales bacterium]
VITQMVVDKDDPAFLKPTKPIGPFYNEEEALQIEKEKGYIMKEDAGRGWRRLVASPLPKRIVEIDSIKKLLDGAVVISCGGGGIPVVENTDGSLEGTAAVIDKDFAAELLAQQIDADILLILTEVEKVSLNFNTPEQKDISHMSLMEAEKYVEQGHFASGSMLPKVLAAMRFVRANPSKKAIISSLDKGFEALKGQTGTVVTCD